MGKHYNFGQVREISPDAAESRIINFILSTDTRDRHGTILNQAGWKLDNYRKNPVVAYQHNLFGDLCNPADPDDIIGKAESIGIESIEGRNALVSATHFEPAEINQNAEKIFRKVLFGSLSATSVGFNEVGNGKYGEGEEARGEVNETYYFSGQELLEYSIVNIPSNPDAGKRKMYGLRDHVAGALAYASHKLNMRYSQLESLRICDVLDLLEGRDLDLKTKDPEKARAVIAESEKAQARLRVMKLKNSHLG